MNKLSVKQNGFRDCAAACLLSIIRYYGGNASKEELNYIIKTDKYGTNAYNLIEGAKTIGFDGYGLKKTYEDLLCYDNLPVIAHTKVNNMYHYVVIYEINKKYIKLMDPEYGLKKVTYNYFNKIYLGTILILYPIKEIPKLKSRDKLFNFIINNFLLYKNKIIKLTLLSLIITILSIIINTYLKVYIDYVLVNYSTRLLIAISICFIMVIFLKNIFENVRSKLLINIKLVISKSVTNMSFNHIMNLPYHHIKSKPTGEISNRLYNLENFKDLVSTIMLNIFVNIFLVVVSMIILIVLNKSLFLISIIVIVLYSIIVFFYSMIFKNEINELQISEGVYSSKLVESLNGYETIKNLNLISETVDNVNSSYSKYLNKYKLFEYSYSNERMMKEIINDLGMLFVSIIGLIFVRKNLMTIGDVIMFTSLVLFFTEPIKELLNLVPSIKYASISYERINDLLMIEKENINRENKKMIDGDISISNLSYSYNNTTNILKGINLKIKKGEKILIHGKSGIGKSTFAKILLKYIESYKGSIKINDINLKDINNDIIRNTFTYISQNEILLSDTIKNNIILNRDISDNQYNEIIKICNVDKIIDNKPLRNNFLIEEDGFNLSGGERQKIILARGLLKKFNILILDEALSEVGYEEEIKIIKEIFEKYKNNTIIYISHKKEIIDFFENKYLID